MNIDLHDGLDCLTFSKSNTILSTCTCIFDNLRQNNESILCDDTNANKVAVLSASNLKDKALLSCSDLK